MNNDDVCKKKFSVAFSVSFLGTDHLPLEKTLRNNQKTETRRF